MMAPLLAIALAVAPAPAAQAATPQAVSGHSFLDEQTTATAERPRSMAQAIGMTMVVLAMGVGVCVAWARGKKPGRVQAAGGQINLLAYKPIGHKQRLALVEVCGERLLLAANEREVTLLSHLPGAVAEAQELAETAAEHVVEAPAVGVAGNVAGQTVRAMEEALNHPAPAQAPTAPAAPSFSSDLAGLQQWQQRAQAERRA
jgi:flagellar biogenesis protein FliO